MTKFVADTIRMISFRCLIADGEYNFARFENTDKERGKGKELVRSFALNGVLATEPFQVEVMRSGEMPELSPGVSGAEIHKKFYDKVQARIRELLQRTSQPITSDDKAAKAAQMENSYELQAYCAVYCDEKAADPFEVQRPKIADTVFVSEGNQRHQVVLIALANRLGEKKMDIGADGKATALTNDLVNLLEVPVRIVQYANKVERVSAQFQNNWLKGSTTQVITKLDLLKAAWELWSDPASGVNDGPSMRKALGIQTRTREALDVEYVIRIHNSIPRSRFVCRILEKNVQEPTRIDLSKLEQADLQELVALVEPSANAKSNKDRADKGKPPVVLTEDVQVFEAKLQELLGTVRTVSKMMSKDEISKQFGGVSGPIRDIANAIVKNEMTPEAMAAKGAFFGMQLITEFYKNYRTEYETLCLTLNNRLMELERERKAGEAQG